MIKLFLQDVKQHPFLFIVGLGVAAVAIMTIGCFALAAKLILQYLFS